MKELILFLFQAVIISLSGVMAPGSMTAATIAQGTQNRWAGALISLGHGIFEIPLIFLLMLGLHFFFEIVAIKIAIGLLGGAFLLWMGYGHLNQIKQTQGYSDSSNLKSKSINAGIILSATNPYFLLWWATVGLNLAIGARKLGIWALIIFAIVHWLCDLIWLSILSFTSFYTNKGAGIFGRYFEQAVLVFCGIALIGFGFKFVYDAFVLWN